MHGAALAWHPLCGCRCVSVCLLQLQASPACHAAGVASSLANACAHGWCCLHTAYSTDTCRVRYVPCREGAAPVAAHSTAYNYNHQSGTLHLPFSNPGSSPVALAEIAAAGRRYPALTQVGPCMRQLTTAIVCVVCATVCARLYLLCMLPYARLDVQLFLANGSGSQPIRH